MPFNHSQVRLGFLFRNNENDTIYDTQNIKSYINGFSFGVMAGYHYRFKGNPGVQIQMNYIHGLTNVYRNEVGRTGYHRTFQIGVMVPIPFGVSSLKEESTDS